MKSKIKRAVVSTKPLSQRRGRPSLSPFGISEDQVDAPISFKGTPEQLGLALERSFMPKAPPARGFIASGNELNRKPVLSDTAKRKAKRKKLIQTAPTPEVTKRVTPKAKKTVKPFDRNRDGASELEIERARHLITNVVDVPKATQLRFAQKLKTMTASLTEFLLLEVAPFDSALDAALADAGESLRLMTGAQNAEFSLGRAEAQLRRLTELKTLDWVCKRLKLPHDVRDMVLNDYMGKLNGSSSQKLHELQPTADGFQRDVVANLKRLQTQQNNVTTILKRAVQSKGKAGPRE